MWIARVALFALALPSFACGSQGGGATGSSSAVASAAPPAASVVAPATGAVGPADDLDLDPLKLALKCPKGFAVVGDLSQPCPVLSRFSGAKAWTGVSPGGEGRFLGRYHTVKGGKTVEGYAVLRTRTVPANEVGAGRVPARLALRVVDGKDPSAGAFEKAIKAFERRDVPASGSPAFDLVKKMDGFVDASAMPTASGKVAILSDDHVFVALGSSQELYVVAPHPTGSVSGDGGYGVLYPMSW